ncbi:MAG: cob(I)yrinic acid a,c-diamide adenosyltransferase [Candidatus Omnitrophica bacterium CG11_big_fil_rev_8_21_14_0_20_42_13]|uniref:corrinoid adenosyltransferase n=1 Tax=Candidatus Ghiorseimicrobium undicola TaxID=1974746 RepID=A0A2H0LZL7_9BACT|nr:MAG: cob(I)yrinic acid a,c-diamide adenosyltransferase [Candidatus Omnitrophica bacterium CG11_big_fil_rev_8_21_14_0_20_42_13]
MIHIYTGNGKGKTTAALGLALRAAGAGLKVYFTQFIKRGAFSEIKAAKKIKNITVEQFGRGRFIKGVPDKKDAKSAQRGLKKISAFVLSGKSGLVIMDEINLAVKFGLIDVKELAELIKKTPANVELVLTGRCAHPEIIKLADLVSEIKEVKHYYKKGMKARKGIEF